MYSIEINFLKDRGLADAGGAAPGLNFKKQEFDVKKNIPILIGGGVMALLPMLAGLGVFWVNFQQAKIKQEIAELDAKIKEIEAKKAEIGQLTEKKDRINADNQALAQVFTGIKPWSALLQDISDQIPVGVQLDTIAESKTEEGEKILTLTGISNSYSSVNDFLLTLQRANFLTKDGTKLETVAEAENSLSVELPQLAGEEDAKAAEIELPPVVTYTIVAKLNDKPATALLGELQRNGAVGLVSRIQTLENKGLIQK